MNGPPRLENCSRVLVVEGYSDLLFYAELLEALGLDGSVFIKHFNGRADLATKLETFLTPQLLAGKEGFAVVVDADDDAQAAASGFAGLLSKITGQGVTAGRWTGGPPRIGLFVTPDGTSAGELETLVWRAWSADPANRAPRDCIGGFINCMANSGFTARSPEKGLVSALLAVRNDEDPRLGPGARAKVFDLAHPEFSPLREFLAGFRA